MIARPTRPTATTPRTCTGSSTGSPDGTLVYALGIEAFASGHESGGSTGIFVFDAATLASVGRWQPTADFVSLAISRDGRFVYATGLPGVDAEGRQNLGFYASITVFDSATGTPRLIAGQLSSDLVTFVEPVLD